MTLHDNFYKGKENCEWIEDEYSPYKTLKGLWVSLSKRGMEKSTCFGFNKKSAINLNYAASLVFIPCDLVSHFQLIDNLLFVEEIVFVSLNEKYQRMHDFSIVSRARGYIHLRCIILIRVQGSFQWSPLYLPSITPCAIEQPSSCII